MKNFFPKKVLSKNDNKGMRVQRDLQRSKFFETSENYMFSEGKRRFYSRKGVVFTFDALFALIIVISIVPLIVLLTVKPEVSTQNLGFQAESSIETLSELTIRNVIKEPVISGLYSRGAITSNDLDRPVIDVIVEMWASNSTTNFTIAQNITQNLLKDMVSGNFQWSLVVENETLFDTGGNVRKTSATGRRVVSGFRKGQQSAGYVASIFLTSIAGKKASFYYFFGGFVGQGNISFNVSDIPSDANVTSIYMEMGIGSNFTLFINNNTCGTFNKSSQVDNWTITSQNCLNGIIAGSNNTFRITFIDGNFAKQFIGGGFLKITYDTKQLSLIEGNSTRKYLPGISGVINYFDSFYVPGSLENMTAYLHYVNNISGATLFFNIGGVEVFRSSNTGEQIIFLNDTYLKSLLIYANLSNHTVPTRFGTEGFGISVGLGGSDSVLITDNSGSMTTCDVSSNTTCNCTGPCRRNRIDVAKEVDKEFVDTILANYTGNRISLVGYTGGVCNTMGFTDNITALKNRIDGYRGNCVGAPGGTCISCGIHNSTHILDQGDVVATLISRKSTWLYNANYPSTEPPADVNNFNWTQKEYNDSSWSSGNAILGFENVAYAPNIDTNIGNNGGNYYFRKHFTINDLNKIKNGELFILSDDMADIYINGMLAVNYTKKFNASYWNRPETIFYDGFESGNLNNWVIDSNNDGGVVTANNTEPFLGSWSAKFYGDGDASTENIWIEKNLNFSNRKSVYLSYYWAVEEFESVEYGNVDVYNGTWNTGVRKHGGGSNRHTTTRADYDYDKVILDVFNLSNGFKIRFSANPSSAQATSTPNVHGDTFFIDEVTVKERLIVDNSYFVNGDNVIAVKLYNNDSNAAKFDLEFNYSENRFRAMLVMSDGQANACLQASCANAVADNETIERACQARNEFGITVYSVAFGSGADINVLNRTACWDCKTGAWIPNCDRFFTSNDAEELKNIYRQIAQSIVNASFLAQALVISGNISGYNNLYTDSYMEFNFTRNIVPPKFQEISVSVETEQFNGCNISFFVPEQFTVIDAKVTSFSGDLWTSYTAVKSDGNWTTVYNLSRYGADYTRLGDPFFVNVPENLVVVNKTNYVNVTIGTSETNNTCSSNNKVIYTARFRASVPYGDIFPGISGGVFRVFYDINHDGTSDGFTDIVVGANLPSFNPTVRTMDQVNGTVNALDDALVRLMDSLNFVVIANNTGVSGTSANPIDIKLSNIDVDVTGTGGIPFAWGPLDVRLDVKV